MKVFLQVHGKKMTNYCIIFAFISHSERDGETKLEYDQGAAAGLPNHPERRLLAGTHEDPEVRRVEEGDQHGQRLQRRRFPFAGIW